MEDHHTEMYDDEMSDTDQVILRVAIVVTTTICSFIVSSWIV